VLEKFSRFEYPFVLDLTNTYAPSEAISFFNNHFVVVDPTDLHRNVAAAVKGDVLSQFVQSSRDFLESPSVRFFFPRKVAAVRKKEIARILRSIRICPVILKMGIWDSRPDILWSQIRKIERRLTAKIKSEGIEIESSGSWSDEKKQAADALLVISCELPVAELRVGPEIHRLDSKEFIEKHEGKSSTLYGPIIKAERILVVKQRRFPELKKLVQEIKNNREFIRSLPVGSVDSFKKAEVAVGLQCANLIKIKGLAIFMKEFLSGKPHWRR
jgi:tRNA nucleotidyltransferase (CCA-adding enzyme)